MSMERIISPISQEESGVYDFIQPYLNMDSERIYRQI